MRYLIDMTMAEREIFAIERHLKYYPGDHKKKEELLKKLREENITFSGIEVFEVEGEVEIMGHIKYCVLFRHIIPQRILRTHKLLPIHGEGENWSRYACEDCGCHILRVTEFGDQEIGIDLNYLSGDSISKILTCQDRIIKGIIK